MYYRKVHIFEKVIPTMLLHNEDFISMRRGQQPVNLLEGREMSKYVAIYMQRGVFFERPLDFVCCGY